MISTKREFEDAVPMRRSMLHSNPFPSEAPDDWESKRLVRWVEPLARDVLRPELGWLKDYGVMLWNISLANRLLTVRNEWSRK